MWLAFLFGISFSTAPLLSFGPFKLYVLSTAVRQGWRKALPLALTPLIADIPIVLILWLVIQQLPDWGLNALRLIGGLFYIYLAVGLVRNMNRTLDEEGLMEQPQRTFWQAITAIWVSPGVYINWSVIGVPALVGYAQQSIAHAIMFVMGFYLTWVTGLGVQIVVLGQVGRISEKANRVMIYIACLLLVGFGIYQAWSGAANLFNG